MVADFMASLVNGASDRGVAQDIHPTLKESALDRLLGEEVEELKRGVAGSIVEGEGDGATGAWPLGYRLAENVH